ncbi:hypothetical protein ACFX15_008307 [Malus domestica]
MLPSLDLRSEYVVFVSCMNVICSRVYREGQYLSGSQTITSPGGTFELGSFTPGQSFDHPTDTWLPGAELGYNLRTKGRRVLTSRRNLQYPAPRLMVSKFSDFL